MENNRLIIIDGNSIMNRAFYGIMGSKMMMTSNGIYTNAIYGFLSILFKIVEDLNPNYIAVAFDLKSPTHRHKMYDAYKATRHGMPDELAMQMPIIKEILSDMNIQILEKEGYEADDILGTLSKKAESLGMDVTILSGDRDTFQLATDKITIQIPRTKMGKTETDNFDRNKVIDTYGIEPKQLIEVKGLMGDASDNIPGVPGIGEKTALKLIQEYGTINNVYQELEKESCSIKGSVKDKLIKNRDLAMLSRSLGEILLKVPIEVNMEDLRVKEWNTENIKRKFEELNFNRYLDRFNAKLSNAESNTREITDLVNITQIDFNKENDFSKILDNIKNGQKLIYHFTFENSENVKIINKNIKSMCIYNQKDNEAIYIYNIISNINKFINVFKDIFEDNAIKKSGYQLNSDYVILKELGINYNNIYYDAEIAGYNLNPTDKNNLENLTNKYLKININDYLKPLIKQNVNKQINLFELEKDNTDIYTEILTVYVIGNLEDIMLKELKQVNALELFYNIEMPIVTVLADMQYQGMYVDKEELEKFGKELQMNLKNLTLEIYNLAGEEFNINSHQQLSKILFEKLKLPTKKKNKSGYSTDVAVLEKISEYHPIVKKILEYRTFSKLNSTYVEGLIPYINNSTNKIHSYFHQTITATGRISSTEPNLQNIPTRDELGKNIRKAFKPSNGKVFIDADYSQIELRVLAHISQDKTMIEAFKEGKDIHKQAASKVLDIPIDEVTKEQRSSAKAVNFGIVYGISDFGLANQLGISNKKAKEYIEQYLKKYEGIKNFMTNIVESAKEKGYVETLFKRRRYIPELKSNNYLVRQFGTRVAMNTPIQGSAADIMKIAMINVFKELQKSKIDAKIVLQIHDELLLEVSEKDKEKAKNILKKCMVNAISLSVPLEVEISEGNNWYEVK